IKYSLLSPLSIFILHHAYQQWRPQRSFQTASHSDIFTYHMVTMELTGAVGAVLYVCGIYTDGTLVLFFGVFLVIFSFPGQIFIHCLTCLDRYLAVIHPVVYLKSRQATGIKIRNFGIFLIWLCGVGTMIMQVAYLHEFPVIQFVGMSVSAFVLVSFCSISVLKGLLRPGPNDISNKKVHRSKRKAFNTITAISVTLTLENIILILCMAVSRYNEMDYDVQCMIFMSGLWANIPNSLV
ncbi:hypothetical protein NQD34_013454, partial [Periophthalmus magnuspinnatus]